MMGCVTGGLTPPSGPSGLTSGAATSAGRDIVLSFAGPNKA
jgi:hypothetical protein